MKLSFILITMFQSIKLVSVNPYLTINPDEIVNPSCLYSHDLAGPYKSSFGILSTPAYRSPELAGEMIELYGMSFLSNNMRNIHPFEEILMNFVNSLGDLTGPYVSQFLWQPFSHGPVDVQQKYRCAQPDLDFMTRPEKYRSAHNGTAPERTTRRYITTLRDGATYVHLDDTFQCGLNVL